MKKLATLLKVLRANYDERLYEMAEKLGCTSAFLSAVENGRRNLTDGMVAKIAEIYNLTEEERIELEIAVSISQKQIKINLEEATQKQAELAHIFAKSLMDMKEEEVEKITAEILAHVV